jgi:acetolactate synthase-1/2/3 large subunit
MGFGLPAAIGAALAAPERKVVGLVGDGTFLMAVSELATIAREQIPLVIVVFADGWLGQIRMQQVDWGAPEFATALHPVDHENVAKSFGIHFEHGSSDLASQLRRCLELNAPAIIEVKLDDPAGLAEVKRRTHTKDRIKRVIGPTGISLLKKLAGGLRK